MAALALLVGGLFLLLMGAEMVVRGGARLATLLGISPMVIGLTIVSVGTSTPELAVGITAGAQDNGGLAVGNIAGTNVFNLLFILALSAVLRPLPLQLQIFKLELPVIVFAAGLMTVLAWDGHLNWFDGAVMFTAGLFYTVMLIRYTRRASRRAKQEFKEEYGPATAKSNLANQFWYLAILLGGIIAIVVGADLLVDGAVDVAQKLGVSDTLIGLTIVAIGTSSPELVTTLISTIRNDRDVAVGNLLGSSIYNILFILSIPCITSPSGLPVEPELLWFDVPLMMLVALGTIPVFLTGQRISRFEGAIGLTIYLCYFAWLVLFRSKMG